MADGQYIAGVGGLTVSATDPGVGDDPALFPASYAADKDRIQNSFSAVSGAVTASHTQLNYIKVATLGTVEPSLAVTVDGSKDVGTFGTVTAATFVGDVTGDLTGAVTATGTLADGVTATNQPADANNTKVATTAYVDSISTATTATANMFYAEERQIAGTNGGTFTAGTVGTPNWETRLLSDDVITNITGATFASNQITLPAGDYYVEFWAAGYGVSVHQTRIYDTTGTAVKITGESAYAHPTNFAANNSRGAGTMTLGVQSAIELQHQCATTVSGNGRGVPSGASFGDVAHEVYAAIKIWKI